ncbi:MAG: dihydrolipoyl dehydrogenase [Planctomycetota bacterium]|nr:MAG: dihydrolipoyl dehydrogenase [Planctomycetota bacterium]
MADYDVIIIGAGPGGYVAAIKAAQNGKKTAIIERESLGGICLNWGCIPTKALLKSAEMLQSIQHADDYGLDVTGVKADFSKVMSRSREVAGGMSNGIDFLMKKNDIEVIEGAASFADAHTIEVTDKKGKARSVTGDAIIIATGHRPRSFPHLPVDGDRVITYRHALELDTLPKSMCCIGAGAIGMEFGYFFSTMGSDVTVVEVMDQVLPNEDHEIAKFVQRQFNKNGVDIKIKTKVTEIAVGKKGVTVHLEDSKGKLSSIEVERVLVAVGFIANTEGLNLDKAGIKLDERGFIQVDEHQRTTADGVYAIGDVAGKQLLAHKASFEGEAAVGHICGHPQPVDYQQIPGCTYCQPQVASLGLSERKAKERGLDVAIGRFQFAASGKAKAIGHPEGFVKLLFEKEYGGIVGAHIAGVDATELLAELSLAFKLESTAKEIMETVHAHPTLSEAVMEAAADALGLCVHQ